MANEIETLEDLHEKHLGQLKGLLPELIQTADSVMGQCEAIMLCPGLHSLATGPGYYLRHNDGTGYQGISEWAKEGKEHEWWKELTLEEFMASLNDAYLAHATTASNLTEYLSQKGFPKNSLLQEHKEALTQILPSLVDSIVSISRAREESCGAVMLFPGLHPLENSESGVYLSLHNGISEFLRVNTRESLEPKRLSPVEFIDWASESYIRAVIVTNNLLQYAHLPHESR